MRIHINRVSHPSAVARGKKGSRALSIILFGRSRAFSVSRFVHQKRKHLRKSIYNSSPTPLNHSFISWKYKSARIHAARCYEYRATIESPESTATTIFDFLCLSFSVLASFSLPFSSLFFSSLLSSSLFFALLRFPSLSFPSLPFPSLPFPSLPFSSLLFPPHHIASLLSHARAAFVSFDASLAHLFATPLVLRSRRRSVAKQFSQWLTRSIRSDTPFSPFHHLFVELLWYSGFIAFNGKRFTLSLRLFSPANDFWFTLCVRERFSTWTRVGLWYFGTNLYSGDAIHEVAFQEYWSIWERERERERVIAFAWTCSDLILSRKRKYRQFRIRDLTQWRLFRFERISCYVWRDLGGHLLTVSWF